MTARFTSGKVALAIALGCTPALAHDVTAETLVLGASPGHLDFELRVAASQLERATSVPLSPDVARSVEHHAPTLAARARESLSFTPPGGAPLPVEIDSVVAERVGDGEVVCFRGHASTDGTPSFTRLEVRDDLVLGELTTDDVFVFPRGHTATDPVPQLLGHLHYQQRAVEVTLASVPAPRKQNGASKGALLALAAAVVSFGAVALAGWSAVGSASKEAPPQGCRS